MDTDGNKIQSNRTLEWYAQALSLISDMVQQKKNKIKNNMDYVMVKDNEIKIVKDTGVFF